MTDQAAGGSPIEPDPAGQQTLGATRTGALPSWSTLPLPISRPAFAVAAVSTVVVLVSTFLPWFTVRLNASTPGLPVVLAGAGTSGDGTTGPMLGTWTLVLSLLTAAVLVLMVARPDPRLWLGLPVAGVLVVIFALVSLARLSSAGDSLRSFTALLPSTALNIGSGVGLWLTLLGGLALIAAGILAWRDQRGRAVGTA